MSLCINDDLIWISNPKCASVSIENAFLESGLDIIHYRYGDSKKYLKHLHVDLLHLYTKFGKKETVIIKRNYVDRWISGLQQMWNTYENNGIKLIKDWEDVDNDFIYKMFTDELIDDIHSVHVSDYNILNSQGEDELNDKIKSIVFKYAKNNNANVSKNFYPYITLISQSYWTNNNKCTYEFDMNEMDKFVKFINERYNVDFNIKKLNESKKIKNNIINNDELRNWIWEKFEKRFESKKSII